MKRGIEVYTDYDEKGRFTHYVKKRKGKLTLDEIREALREYEEDYYLLVVDAYHDPNEDFQFGDDQPVGDLVEAHVLQQLQGESLQTMNYDKVYE